MIKFDCQMMVTFSKFDCIDLMNLFVFVLLPLQALLVLSLWFVRKNASSSCPRQF